MGDLERHPPASDAANTAPPALSDALDKLKQLPTVSAAVREVVRSLGEDSVNTAELAHEIAMDHSLAIKVLRVANSAFYGLAREVGSIEEAVMVLGFNAIRSLALTVGLLGSFPTQETGAFDRKKFWWHSMAVAVCSRSMAARWGLDRELAFTAGLLHDIGRLALAVVEPDRLEEINARAASADLLDAEREVLGYDHAMLGAELAKRWNFPEAIQDVMLHYSEPEPMQPMVRLVHLACSMAGAAEAGGDVDAMLCVLPVTVRAEFDGNRDRIERCLEELEQMRAMSGSLLGS
jgi:putative nucleotidyltransferase with HDIG domain